MCADRPLWVFCGVLPGWHALYSLGHGLAQHSGCHVAMPMLHIKHMCMHQARDQV